MIDASAVRRYDSLKPPRSAIKSYSVFLIVLAMGMDISLAPGIGTTQIAILVSIPYWFSDWFRNKYVKTWVALWVFLVAWGTFIAMSGTVPVDPDGASATLRFVLSGALVVPVLLASMRELRFSGTLLSYSLGMVLGGLLHAGSIDGNTWKYVISYPVTVFLLAMADGKTSSISVILLFVLAGIGIMSDARSYMGFCVLTAFVLMLSTVAKTLVSARYRIALGTIVLVIAAYVVFQSLVSMLMSGDFGSQLQDISQGQAETSGSVLAGGRPEWFATWGLMQHRPWGYAPGAVPTYDDLVAARTGLAQINVSGLSDYYQVYMFGGHFKLHSTLADLWVNFGIPGLTVGIALAIFFLVRVLESTFGRKQASGLDIFVTISALWALAFAPILSNFFEIALAFVVLASRHKSTLARESDVRLSGYDAQFEPVRGGRW